MRVSTPAVSLLALAASHLFAQARAKFPPDSLVNTKVIPKSTPVLQVIGTMRNFTSDLGVRCQFCHVGEEGQPLTQFNFVSDEKRTKLVARQMMLLVQEANRRVDTVPGHSPDDPQVTCATCHRGVSKPMPLSAVIIAAATAGGADSGVKAYRALRQRYYGSGAYDFGEGQLNIAAFRLGAGGAAAQRRVLPEFVGDVRVPGERAAHEGGYGGGGDSVPRSNTERFDEQ
jgi:hypothetical protein